MKTIDLNKLVRKNILSLQPYSSARDEYKGEDAVFLDANENPNNFPYNRYPDPLQLELKSKISAIKNIGISNIFLGNGSDEAIDLLIRVFCNPGVDSIVCIDPTYGMYKVCAEINYVEFIKVSLTNNFDLDTDKLLKAISKLTKLIFLCSPNNPSSNSLQYSSIIEVLNKFNGIVVLDEAYIDFSVNKSLINEIVNYQNLVILQTLSKAWGLAGIRLGMAFADTKIIELLNKIKYPYNINSLSLNKAIANVSNEDQKNNWVKEILNERKRVEMNLKDFKTVEKIFPSDSNFLLIKFKDSNKIFNYLIDNKIIIRNRSNQNLCENCLRLTIGTKDENDSFLFALKKYK